MAKKKKKKLSKFGRILTNIILIVCLGVAVFSGYKIWSTLSEYKKNDDMYADLSEAVVSTPEASADTEEVSIDWDALQAINSDIVGWIRQDDTPIDYPIVIGDDNSYYLRHTIYGEYSLYGTLFIDYRNNGDFSDKNTVIYGHHFYHYDDVMFTSLEYYADQSYYDTHTSLDLYTPQGNYKLYPIAGTVQNETDAYIRTSFTDNADFYDYVCTFIQNSTFTSTETVTQDDQIVLLSTCTNLLDDGRYALVCKLVKVSEG